MKTFNQILRWWNGRLKNILIGSGFAVVREVYIYAYDNLRSVYKRWLSDRRDFDTAFPGLLNQRRVYRLR